MPFPLAHPAAILPLRRFCPRRLDFPALVIGSLVPDLGYPFGQFRVADFSHRLIAGALGFGLPVGFLIWLAFDRLRGPIIARLPLRYRTASPPAKPRPSGRPWIVALSLLLGDWSHWLLDSFTHWNGWFVLHLPPLQRPLFHLGHQFVWTYDFLYYLCTFLGTFCVAMAYSNWLQRASGSPAGTAAGLRYGSAVLLAAGTVAAACKSRFAPTNLILYSGALATLLILACFVVGTAVYFIRTPAPASAGR